MTSLRTLILSALSVAFLGLAAPTAMANPNRAPAAQVERSAAPQGPTDREIQRYAEREQQSGQLEQFEGGRTVIVIGSLGALLLGALLVLLLV
jgi:hypothetical protein